VWPQKKGKTFKNIYLQNLWDLLCGRKAGQALAGLDLWTVEPLSMPFFKPKSPPNPDFNGLSHPNA
jgi:hypothetical protein